MRTCSRLSRTWRRRPCSAAPRSSRSRSTGCCYRWVGCLHALPPAPAGSPELPCGLGAPPPPVLRPFSSFQLCPAPCCAWWWSLSHPRGPCPRGGCPRLARSGHLCLNHSSGQVAEGRTPAQSPRPRRQPTRDPRGWKGAGASLQHGTSRWPQGELRTPLPVPGDTALKTDSCKHVGPTRSGLLPLGSGGCGNCQAPCFVSRPRGRGLPVGGVSWGLGSRTSPAGGAWEPTAA